MFLSLFLPFVLLIWIPPRSVPLLVNQLIYMDGHVLLLARAGRAINLTLSVTSNQPIMWS